MHKFIAAIIAATSLLLSACDEEAQQCDLGGPSAAAALLSAERLDALRPRADPEVLVAAETVSIMSFADIVAACQLDDVPVQITLTGYEPAAEKRVIGIGAAMWAHEQQYQCWREILVGKLDAA